MEQDKVFESLRRYNHKNPPLDRATAEKRVCYLCGEIAHIQAQLDCTDEYSLMRPHYADWRSRADAALGFKEREVAYLRQWMVLDESDRLYKEWREQNMASRDEYLEVFAHWDRINGRVLALMEEIIKDYALADDGEYADGAATENRARELKHARLHAEHGLSEITRMCAGAGLSSALGVAGVKDPLRKLLLIIQEKRELLFSLRAQSPATGKNRSFKAVCTDVLMRAVSEGFVLTDEEQRVLHFIPQPPARPQWNRLLQGLLKAILRRLVGEVS